MKLEETKAEEPIRLGDIALVPILRTSMSAAGGEAGVVVLGSSRPIGIVVVYKSRRYAMSLDGEKVPINRYLEQVRGLSETLETLQGDVLTPGGKRPQDSS